MYVPTLSKVADLRNRPRKSLNNDFHLKIAWNGDHFGIIRMDFKSSTNWDMWIKDVFTGVEIPKINFKPMITNDSALSTPIVQNSKIVWKKLTRSFNRHSRIDFLDLFPTLPRVFSNEDIRNESESGSFS